MDLMERDNYCRRCGIKQPGVSDIMSNRVATGAVTVIGFKASNLMNQIPVAPTSPLSETSALSETDTYRKVSGPLVEAVATGISSRAIGKFHSKLIKQSLSALISIPIWLMIILLSPFDAYFAAKRISSQVAPK
jgi:hypothetical protein